MKTSNVHAILSDLHRLLSVYSATDLAQASEYRGISPRVRTALRALTDESGVDSGGLAPRQSGREKPEWAVSGAPPSGSSDLATEIVSAIRNQAGRFSSTSSILQFAKDAGLSVQARNKESRERLSRRVAEAILQVKEPRRSQIVSLIAGVSDSQTQGWINVIKNRRP